MDQATFVDFEEQRRLQVRKNRLAMAAREAEEMQKQPKPRALTAGQLLAGKSLINNQSVPMAKRARFVDISHWNTVNDPASLFSSVDGVVAKIGGMDIGDGKGAKMAYEDSKWSYHTQLVFDNKRRLEGYFFTDPDYHLLKQRNLDWVKNQPYTENEVLIRLISSLHNGSWTWDTLRPDQGWKPIEAVWLDAEETDAWNGKITPPWQEATIANLLDPLLMLQQRERIPTDWQLGCYLRPLWLRDDCKNPDGSNPLETYLFYRRDRLRLWMAQWVFALDPDIQLKDLDDLWANYLPPDTFKWLYMPNGYDNRIWHHQFTGERFDVPEYVPEVDANLFYDTVEVYDQITGFSVNDGDTGGGGEVPQPGEVTLEQILQAVQAVDGKVEAINARLKAAGVELGRN